MKEQVKLGRLEPTQATNLFAEKIFTLHTGSNSNTALAYIARYHLQRRGGPKHSTNFLIYALVADLKYFTPTKRPYCAKVIEFLNKQAISTNNEISDFQKRVHQMTFDDIAKIVFYGSMVSDNLKRIFVDRSDLAALKKYQGFILKLVECFENRSFFFANYEADIHRIGRFEEFKDYYKRLSQALYGM